MSSGMSDLAETLTENVLGVNQNDDLETSQSQINAAVNTLADVVVEVYTS